MPLKFCGINWKLSLLILAVFVTLGLITYQRPFESDKSITPAELEPGSHLTGTANSIDQKLVFCSDPWPPYAGYAGDEQEGYIVDLLREIFQSEGYQIRYINAPWSRCIQETRNGVYTGLAGADVDEVTDFVFPKNTIGITQPTFFTLKTNGWTFSQIDSLQKIKLGAIQDYTYSKNVDEYIKQFQSSNQVLLVRGVDPLNRLVESLLAGRIDAFIENGPVVYATIKKMGLDPALFRQAGQPELGVRLFVAFSPNIDNAKHLTNIFDEGISELRNSGRLDQITSQYGITDWLQEANAIQHHEKTATEDSSK
jgi:polar amino acid transport system substrate-binding protein